MEIIRKNWAIIVFIAGVIVLAAKNTSATEQNSKDIQAIMGRVTANEVMTQNINTQFLVWVASVDGRLRGIEQANGIKSALPPKPITEVSQ